MLDWPNSGHMARDKLLFVTSWTEGIMSSTLFQYTFILRRPREVNFTDLSRLKKKVT